MKYRATELLYKNSLSKIEDIGKFIMEGPGTVSFPRGRMRLESIADEGEGQKDNFVYWCDQILPDNIEISWDFYPIREPGLCMLFFAATGRIGDGLKEGDIFGSHMAKREGIYNQYNRGDINALHVSYFRRKAVKERAFQVCNLRKSFGFHLVAKGADPIPCINDVIPPYRIKVIKYGAEVQFQINDLELFHWLDDGISFGDVLTGGRIGFRQMAPLIAEYSNLTVYQVEAEPL